MTDRQRALSMDLAAAGLLFIIVFALYCPVLVKPGALIYNEDIDVFFPYEIIAEDSYVRGDFPLWNPYLGGGSPSLSRIQAGLLYPPMVALRLLLPVVARLNWDVVLDVFIAGLGVYWLMRDLVTSRTAAIFSAIAFMLSGSIIPRVFAGHLSVLHAVAWTGWLLFVYRRMLYRRSWWYLVLTVFFSALIVLGGHPQLSAIVFLAPISYFVFVFIIEQVRIRQWTELFKGFALSIMVAVLTVSLIAVQLIAYLEWLTFTRRGAGGAFDTFEIMVRHSVELPHLLTVFLPLSWFVPESGASIYFSTLSYLWELSPFVGVLPLFLIVSGFLVVRDQKWHLVAYFAGMALFALVMSMGTYNPAHSFILDKLPYFRGPGRILLLWTFALAILAGFALDGLLKILNDSEQRPQFKRAVYLVSALSMIGISLVVWWVVSGGNILALLAEKGYLAGNDPNVLLDLLRRSSAIFAVTLVIITGLFWLARVPAVKSRLWGWLAIAVLVLELILFARPLVRAYPVVDLFDSQHPLAKLQIDPGDVRIDGYRTPINYLVPTLAHVRNGEEHVALFHLLQDTEKGQQLLSASYIVTVEPIDDPAMELIQEADAAYLYRHANTSPRIYAADSVVLAHNDDEALAFILSDSFDRQEQSVLTVPTENNVPSAEELEMVRTATGEVNFSGEYISYGNDLISASVSVDQPAMVVFTELYYPGWLATVDGQPVNVFKANYAFRGVPVSAGEHIIEMRFTPPSFQFGAAVSLVTIFALSAISLWLVSRHLARNRH